MIILLRLNMPRFKKYDYRQCIMLAINLEDQLQSGTFEHAIHFLIENHIDLSVFDQDYNNNDTGRPAYDPALLLKIVLFAYYKRITSSREIEWCCRTNIIFKALSCDLVPHWTTIAGFVSNHTLAIASVFEEVLLVCDQQGLIGHALLAIDGCKMSSNAAKEWSGTISELEDKHAKLKRQIAYHLAEHKASDLQDNDDQSARHQQAIATLSKAAAKVDKFLSESSARMGKGQRPKEVKSNITDNESAKMTTSKGTIQGYNGVATVDKLHQVIVDASAFGEGQEHHALQPVLEKVDDCFRRLGLNDQLLKTAIITADTGFANEANMVYLHQNNINGYIPDNQFRSRDPKFQDRKAKHPDWKRPNRKSQHLIPASEFNLDPVNKACVCPAGQTMWLRSEGLDRLGHPKLFFEGRLTKCRTCLLKSKCMRNPSSADTRKGHGRQVSFILNEKRTPTYTDWMKHRVDSPKGKQIYSHRMSVVEPVFGNIGYNKRLNRFSLRGKKKVNTQWQLYCLVHNIEKLQIYGQIAA